MGIMNLRKDEQIDKYECLEMVRVKLPNSRRHEI